MVGVSDREVLAKRLNEAGLLEDRLIPVRDGEKASVVNHHDPDNRYSNFAGISGNYGVYAGANPAGDRWLIDVDVDDYAEDADSDGLEAVNSLPETLTIESPHTDGTNGGHRYYVIVRENVDQHLNDAIGVYNPVPSWGEVRVRNQYVVGPGSELDSCDKDWHDCSEEGEGTYTIANDAPIAEIELDDLVDLLRQSGYDGSDSGGQSGQNATNGNLSTDIDSDGYEEALEVARNDSKIVTYLTEGADLDFDGDRSDADFYVACRMVENYVPERQARELLENGLGEGNTPNTKVRERGDSYWRRTWENARQKVAQDDNSGHSGKTGEPTGSDSDTPIVVENGRTYYVEDGEKTEVLNFELDVESILRVDNREVIEANLRRSGGSTHSVQFEPRHLQKKQRFKDNVLDGKFGLTFTPPSLKSEVVLNELNEYIGTLDVPVRQGTHHIGLHDGEWVTPDGSLGSDGWVDEPGYTYINRNVALERALSLPTETAEYDSDDVERIVTALPQTRDTARMLAVLGWFYAAPLRPYIFEDWGAGAFNHLNITGDTGSGKTTTLRYLWRCFGVEEDPFDVADTKFAMLSALAASNGLPVWYDEYKPSEIQDYRLDQFHDLYRKAATGGTATRGRADQTTEEYHTHAPVIVSGEEQIRRPAERRRSIMVSFREEVTAKGTETRATFKKLVGEGRVQDGELVLPDHAPDPTNHALAYYRWITGRDATELRAKWQDARELVWQKRREWNGEYDLDDMEIQGLQTVAFGWMLMRAFAQEHGVELADLPDETDLDDALRHVAGEIGPDGQRKSHMDRFVELFERAAAADYVERGQHYDVVHEGSMGEEELRVHLSRTYDALSKYARDHGLDSQELLSNPDDYRKRFKEATESGETYVANYSQQTPGLGRCAGIYTVATMTELDFDRQTFGLDPIGGGSKIADSDGSQKATADGGEVEGSKAKVEQYLRTDCKKGNVVTVADVAGSLDGLSPDEAESALDRIQKQSSLLQVVHNGWKVLQ